VLDEMESRVMMPTEPMRESSVYPESTLTDCHMSNCPGQANCSQTRARVRFVALQSHSILRASHPSDHWEMCRKRYELAIGDDADRKFAVTFRVPSR
jgi:hypothetical protein